MCRLAMRMGGGGHVERLGAGITHELLWRLHEACSLDNFTAGDEAG